MSTKTKQKNTTNLLLRLGLAFVFSYAAIASLRQPAFWAVYLPNFLTGSISATLLIKIFAVYELGLAAWLIIGKRVRYAALLSTLTLVGIVIMNTSQFTTTFRDVGLIFMAAALFFAER